jgi:uncharacterized protein with NRDE domain
MKVDQKGHTITIKYTQGDFTSFLDKVSQSNTSFDSHNLIIDLTHNKSITLEDLKLLLPLAKQHKKLKKSFVVVVEGVDFNAVPNKLVVVPSNLEAHDIIEMDEIERDLGF